MARNEDRPADDAEDVHDEPNKEASETAADCMARHEELHREHRGRLDEHDEHIDEHHGRLSAIEKHLNLRGEERSGEERGEAQERRGEGIRQRRRHD